MNDKGVADECVCGVAMLVEPDDRVAWTCTVCGELFCELCEHWIQAGLYGHLTCLHEDGDARQRVWTRIGALATQMPMARLKRVLELVEYLSPEEQRRETEIARLKCTARRGAA